MAVIVEEVKSASIAERLGIKPGDALLSVNGHEIRDILDYGFYTAEEKIVLEVSCGGKEVSRFSVRKSEYEDLGLSFSGFLMDSERSCENNCIFCFIDQLPEGMRSSLYFKDDDERLSYLFGNYISLTNLSEEEFERLIEMRISPVNISVHATDPALRCYMMGNNKAGATLSLLPRLAKAGIEFNCQIVLCPGVNDGEELERTMSDLAVFYPSLKSVSVVPVGLTAHRNELTKLNSYGAAEACETLSAIEKFGAVFLAEHGVRLFYPSDEWYLLAKKELPELGYYDELLQLENGVGMLALFKAEFSEVLARFEHMRSECFQAVSVDIITGEAAAELISALIETAKKMFPQIKAVVHIVKNEFFGGNVNVAGLLTGGDIMRQVNPDDITGEKIIIPRSSLRSEGDIFLDDVSLDDLSVYYNREVIPVSEGYGLFSVLGRELETEGGTI